MPRYQDDPTSGFGAVRKCECGHLRLAHILEYGCGVPDCDCDEFAAAVEQAEDE